MPRLKKPSQFVIKADERSSGDIFPNRSHTRTSDKRFVHSTKNLLSKMIFLQYSNANLSESHGARTDHLRADSKGEVNDRRTSPNIPRTNTVADVILH